MNAIPAVVAAPTGPVDAADLAAINGTTQLAID